MVKLTNQIQVAKFVVFTALMMMPYQNMGRAYKPEPRGTGPAWAKTEVHGKERTTVLQFYLHDVVTAPTGNNPTAIQVVPAPGSTRPFTGFGFIAMADDPLTFGPDPRSKLVGRAQGMYGGASQEDPSLMMALALTFEDGIYKGSSISILGRNMITTPEREFPVVGGTGFFRMARGCALAKTYFYNITSANAIVGYNVTVFH